MNATLQSLFSLQIFIQDIRCLADLHSARASCGRERRFSLLKTLKRTITANDSNFCGDEQQARACTLCLHYVTVEACCRAQQQTPVLGPGGSTERVDTGTDAIGPGVPDFCGASQ
ncbi:hypothetical protein SKAU_G00151790 [Synaphobranchus kaupii]|uniref:Uncharacterized protein n=1 Tax=Synaphobranchus kaupii TaxID=118154 RepID=A0A9Q1FGS8_SYNKA|nr:hypothetical protein SKAU_G00151790 [Synaphobranchus kaupii]